MSLFSNADDRYESCRYSDSDLPDLLFTPGTRTSSTFTTPGLSFMDIFGDEDVLAYRGLDEPPVFFDVYDHDAHCPPQFDKDNDVEVWDRRALYETLHSYQFNAPSYDPALELSPIMTEELLPSLPQQSASPPSPPATLPPTTFHEPLALPDPTEYVRESLCIPPWLPVNLWSVLDDGLRPATALHLLVRLAICGSEKKMLTLRGIYEALQQRFAFFRSTDRRETVAWQDSVRHAMSLYRIFVSRERDMNDKGRGSYWTIDIRNGEGYKRDRKRAAAGIQKQTARIKMSRKQHSTASDSRSTDRAGWDKVGRAIRDAPSPYLVQASASRGPMPTPAAASDLGDCAACSDPVSSSLHELNCPIRVSRRMRSYSSGTMVRAASKYPAFTDLSPAGEVSGKRSWRSRA